MILQILSYSWEIYFDVDACLFQKVHWSYSASLQDQRGAHRASCQNYFSRGKKSTDFPMRTASIFMLSWLDFNSFRDQIIQEDDRIGVIAYQ
jgi:hypothetical protein